MKRILTGLQPSGCITIGNYIGAIKQMVQFQNEYDSFIFVADMHAITVRQEPKNLRKNCMDLLAIFLACGLDGEKEPVSIEIRSVGCGATYIRYIYAARGNVEFVPCEVIQIGEHVEHPEHLLEFDTKFVSLGIHDMSLPLKHQELLSDVAGVDVILKKQ
jgi:hypothetical protein